MQSDRWQQVKELLNEVLEREPAERTAFLDAHCAGDHDLRHEVDSLLASLEHADDFMEKSDPPDIRTSQEGQERRIGPYVVTEELGRGGMGSVYKAVRQDDPLRKAVALKIVRRGMDHEFIVRRFRNERSILAALNHPNIAKLIDGGATDDGIPYFVMEYVAGGKNIIRFCDDQQLDTHQRLQLFVSVCSAVQAAHDRRIVHRDIKPGNILIDEDGQAKLLDFGIAKILDPELTGHTLEVTATMLRLMTPEYASPEQVRGGEITSACDIYSLGVLLYELLTGHRPYRLRGKSPHEVAHVICHEIPERPSTMAGRTELVTRGDDAVTVTPESISATRRCEPSELRRSLSGDLDTIVLTAMRKEPERRYASALALSGDIRRHLQGIPITARSDDLLFKTSRFFQQRRIAVAGLAAALAVGAGLMFLAHDYLLPAGRSASTQPKIVPITSFPGDETQPAFSPDSTQLAFVWEGEDSGNSDIYLKPVQGVGLERITTDVAEDVSPTWSPDGKRLAWLRTSHTETAIFSSIAQPAQQHQKIASLYPNRIEAVGRHLDWSPRGRDLAAADKNTADEPFRIVLIDVLSGQKRPFTTPPPGTIGDSNPAWSPDGKMVAFIRAVSSGVDDIFVLPVEGGEPRRLTNDKRYVISLAWSADSQHVLFSSNRLGNHSLWRVHASGGTPERVDGSGDGVSDPVLSRNGKYMAFSQFYMDTNIWALDLRTLARRKLLASTQYDSSPHYSADGSSIVFRSSRSGTNEIWMADADARHETQVTHMGNTLSGSPKLSPDGKRIAFDSRPEGQPDIFTAGLDGSGLLRVTADPAEDVVPDWSQDGKWIYFGSNRGGSWQVWKAPSGGGTAVALTTGGGFAARESRDGKWVYYARGRSVDGLWRVRPDGTGEQQATSRLRPGLWGYWAVSRQGIYFADRDTAKSSYSLYFLPEGHQDPQRLAFFDRPLIPGDQGMALSPDGKTLLYTQIDQSGSDILMLETQRRR